MESTRYSLVKGERIVRFVLTTWLRDLLNGKEIFVYNANSASHFFHLTDVGLSDERSQKALLMGFDGP